MLRIFTTVKIQRLPPGLNPQTWVPEASMLTTRPPKPSNIATKQGDGFIYVAVSFVLKVWVYPVARNGCTTGKCN